MKIATTQAKNGKWHWRIVGEDGKAIAAPPPARSFATKYFARADAQEFAQALHRTASAGWRRAFSPLPVE